MDAEQAADIAVEVVQSVSCELRVIASFGKDETALNDGLKMAREGLWRPTIR